MPVAMAIFLRSREPRSWPGYPRRRRRRGCGAGAWAAWAAADDRVSPERSIWGPQAVGAPPASAATHASAAARSREGRECSAVTVSGVSYVGSAEEVMWSQFLRSAARPSSVAPEGGILRRARPDYGTRRGAPATM